MSCHNDIIVAGQHSCYSTRLVAWVATIVQLENNRSARATCTKTIHHLIPYLELSVTTYFHQGMNFRNGGNRNLWATICRPQTSYRSRGRQLWDPRTCQADRKVQAVSFFSASDSQRLARHWGGPGSIEGVSCIQFIGYQRFSKWRLEMAPMSLLEFANSLVTLVRFLSCSIIEQRMLPFLAGHVRARSFYEPFCLFDQEHSLASVIVQHNQSLEILIHCWPHRFVQFNGVPL